jgi:two-component system, NtrC family, sensor kinase
MNIKTSQLTLILCLCYLSNFAQPLVWNDALDGALIGEQISYFEDDSKKLTIDQISSPDFEGRFTASQRKVLKFSELGPNYWLKFQIENPHQTPLVLELGLAALATADLYYKTDTNPTWQVLKAGHDINLYEKPFKHHHQIFPIATSGTYYMNVSAGVLPLPLSIKKQTTFELQIKHQLLVIGVYVGLMLFVTLYNLFLFFSFRQYIYLLYATHVGLMLAFVTIGNGFIAYWLPHLNLRIWYVNLAICFPIVGLSYSLTFLKVRQFAPRLLPFGVLIMLTLFALFVVYQFIPELKLQTFLQSTLFTLMVFTVTAAIIVGRKGNRMGYYFALTYVIFIVFYCINTVYDRTGNPPLFLHISYGSLGILVEILFQSFLLTKQFEWEKADVEAEKAQSQAQLLEKTRENAQFVREQNIILESKVAERTAELEQSLTNLHATQNQLIQSEKLASLGELTAGIAHEIQNPLNFVTNFSELSIDLMKDLKEEMQKTDKDEDYIDELFDDLSQNQEKIKQHGNRASSIVRGMLEHSRSNTGERRLTDINNLCDEFLRLSFHGMRAKDKSFNADFKTDFDPNLPKINITPQNISRVILNLVNNAFYAVNEKKTKSTEGGYLPSVFVSTQKIDNQILIKIKDNGSGMPEAVLQKIFQPFFTTKPAGEGTGLGLSLSYDIITKGHGGTIEVESVVGQGTEFKINLPLKNV